LQADVNICTGASGDTPLHVAATNGQTEAVRALFACGANIKQTNISGWTALHQVFLTSQVVSNNYSRPKTSTQAAANGRKECVAMLLDLGTPIDCLAENGWTPLFAAANNGGDLPPFGCVQSCFVCV